MKIRPYFEKLEKSTIYKDFKIKYPDSFAMAGFFVLDLENGKNIHQIDFYIPREKKVAAFSLDGQVELRLLDALGMEKGKMPEKLEIKAKTDLDEIEGILLDEMHNRGMSEEIKKIIAVLQNMNGRKVWLINCVLGGMEILKSHIEDSSKTVLKIEKISLLDIMRKLPQQPAVMPQPGEETKDDLQSELQKIGKVQEKLMKEKERVEKELVKKKNTVKKIKAK